MFAIVPTQASMPPPPLAASRGEPAVSVAEPSTAIPPMTTVVDHHRDWILDIARSRVRSYADAEDIAQRVLLKVHLRGDSYQGRSVLRGWIYRIVVNELADWHRARARSRVVSLGDLKTPPIDRPRSGAGSAATPVLALEREEQAATVRTAVDRLPAHYREAVMLRDLHGLPYDQSVDSVSVPPGTFRTRVHRGRRLLPRALSERRP